MKVLLLKLKDRIPKIPHAWMKCPKCGFTAPNDLKVWGKAEFGTKGMSMLPKCPKCKLKSLMGFNHFLRCQCGKLRWQDEQSPTCSGCGSNHLSSAYHLKWHEKVLCLFGRKPMEVIN